MLDYKTIITRRFGAGLSGSEIARQLGVSSSGVNDFLKAFTQCSTLGYPLPDGITNYGIAEHVYGFTSSFGGRDTSYEYPDYPAIHQQLTGRQNMTLTKEWNRYKDRCQSDGKKFYQYTQFCDLYDSWCEENYESLHLTAVKGQKMEVDFAGKTFKYTDRISGETVNIVVFVSILPYSQYIYAEGMSSTKEPQWIEANNHAIEFFGGVPAIVVCDNCKQAVTANKDWIDPDLNRDYAEWADHNHTAIIPAKVRRPKFKSSVENAVGILEKGIFLDLEEKKYFSLEQFNSELRKKIDKLNSEPFKKREHNRHFYWEEEKGYLMPLPSMQYQYMERKVAKVSSDFHVRFDNAYYSVDKAFLHKKVLIGATADLVRISSVDGNLICEWPRATHFGEWKTDPGHLPLNYKEMSEWNGTYFIGKALSVGPNTTEVIKAILKSKKYEVQTYRLCLGVLNLTKNYSKSAMETCCAAALKAGRPTYTFIKNSIHSVAEDIGTEGFNTKLNEEKNQGAFVMGPQASDIGHLLARSMDLARNSRKEAGND